jgi:hypothetical protein
MPTFRASLNIDFTGQVPNQYQRLVSALIQAGWLYVETSAYVIETDDITNVWRGIELVAKQSSDAGQLSALTFHVQSASSFAVGLPYPAQVNHPNALAQVQAKQFP